MALYDTLAVMVPSPVVEANRAVAATMAQGPVVGLELLHRVGLVPEQRRTRLFTA